MIKDPDTSNAKPAPAFSRFSSWVGRASKSLLSFSPSEIKSRLDIEKAVPEVCYQLMHIITQAFREKQAEATLEELERHYGKNVIDSAMASACWSAHEKHKDGLWWGSVTPAMMISLLPSQTIAEKLAPMVPEEHWSHRVKTNHYAFSFELPKKMGINVDTLSPLMILCANQNMSLLQWEQRLSLIAKYLPSPSKEEAFACVSMLRHMPDPDHAAKRIPILNVWLESLVLKDAMEPLKTHEKAKEVSEIKSRARL